MASVSLQHGMQTENIISEAKAQVRKEIGPVAVPDFVVHVSGKYIE